MLGKIHPRTLTLMRTLCTIAISISIVLSAHYAHAQEKALSLGLIPHMAATDMARRYAPLAEYLSQSIGAPVHLKFYKHFERLLTNIGFSSTMQSQIFGPLNEKYMEYASDINSSGTHLPELINDILDVSAVKA